MPVYTFQCQDRGYKFSGRFSMAFYEGEGVCCPQCQGVVHRIFENAPGMIVGKSQGGEDPGSICRLGRACCLWQG